jgi:hypothetical protein
MCKGIICNSCVHEQLIQHLGVQAANIVKHAYDSWRTSCPDEDVLFLGTMIPLFLNLLQFELQYYFLYTISLNFDPLTLYEWGVTL